MEKGQCVPGEGTGSLLLSVSPASLRQNLGLVHPPRVGAASFRGPLFGPPLSWGSRHLQEKPQLVASALESELQASCLHNKPSGLPSHLPSP